MWMQLFKKTQGTFIFMKGNYIILCNVTMCLCPCYFKINRRTPKNRITD